MSIKGNIFIILFLPLVVPGCRSISQEEITISGYLSKVLANVEGKKIFLYDLAKKDVAKDSAIVKNNSFIFKIRYDSNFIPFCARLMYFDTIRDASLLKTYGKQDFIAYLRPIGIINPYDSNAIESLFYVELGNAILHSTNARSGSLTINAGKQNIPFYKHVSLLPLPDSPNLKRKNVLAYNKKTIQQYSYSYALLTQLDRIKNGMTEDELNGLSDLFDEDMNAHSKFKEYIAYKASKKTSANDNYNLITLEDYDGSQSSLLTDSKFKLLVFWASWCGPCRAEIPSLKKLFHEHGSQGLSIVSVSIDNNKSNWKLALSQEKMPWKQLIIPGSDEAKIDAIFDIQSIPLMLLIDGNNQIVERIVGMDENMYQIINKKIGKYLSS